MESRRKPVIRTYGTKSTKSQKEADGGFGGANLVSKTDNFDIIFGKKSASEGVKGRVPLSGEDPFDFAVSSSDTAGSQPQSKKLSSSSSTQASSNVMKRPSPVDSTAAAVAVAAAAKSSDPFAFSDDDVGGTAALKKETAVKRAKQDSSSSSRSAMVTKTSFSSSVVVPLLSDSVLKVDRQMKIDSFTVAMPRLKPSATSAASSSSSASVSHQKPPIPPPQPQPQPPSQSEPYYATSNLPAPTLPTTAPRPSSSSSSTNPNSPNDGPVQSEIKRTEPERKIFTTERSDRRKIANPRSWFASDEDEEDDYDFGKETTDRKNQTTTTNKSQSVAADGHHHGASSSSAAGSQQLNATTRTASEHHQKHNPSSTRTGSGVAVPSSATTVVDATGKRSVRVHRSEKDQYAVVRHVRGVSELQAEGSSLEYDGDYSYLVECLGSPAQISSRCLSALQLASKCAETSDFRLYLKSTGKLPEVFTKMQDSDKYDLLALCAAAIFLVLSSDRSQVDLDTNSLHLLVKLVKLQEQQQKQQQQQNAAVSSTSATSSTSTTSTSSSTSLSSPSLPSSSSWTTAVPQQISERVVNGIASIVKSLQRKYGADYTFCASAESPSVISEMALSSLHTLSHRCSSESMQNEFRESGALEILVENCIRVLDKPDLSQEGVTAYSKRVKQQISGILKLVSKNKESKRVASECNDNKLPRALARFSCALLPDTFAKHFTVGENEARLLSQSYNLMMVLCCDTKTTCGALANECPDFLSVSARLALIGNKSLEDVHTHFDLSILSFFVLVNIFEYSPVAAAVSHPYGSDGPSLVSLLIEFFNFLCTAAAECEREADEQISNSQSQGEASSKSANPRRPSSAMEATVAADDGALDAMLQAAGTRHMELNFLAACCCIVVFYAADIEPRSVETVRKLFSGSNFDMVVDVLKRFLTFTALVNGADDRTLETVAKILEKYDAANRAAGFGVSAPPSNASNNLGGTVASSSAVASSSSLNWATPPGTSGDSAESGEDDSNSESSNHAATAAAAAANNNKPKRTERFTRAAAATTKTRSQAASSHRSSGDDNNEDEDDH